jgi:hypothetical protein
MRAGRLAAALLCAALAGCGGASSQSPSTGSGTAAGPSGAGANGPKQGAQGAQGEGTSGPRVSLPEPVALPKPPFRRFVADEVAKAAKPRKRKPSLTQLSMKLNEITDTERWFRDHAFTLPVSHDAPPGAATYRGVPLSLRIEGNPTLLVYQSRVVNPMPGAQAPAANGGQAPAANGGQVPAANGQAPAANGGKAAAPAGGQAPAAPATGQAPAPAAGQAADAQQAGSPAYLVGMDPDTGEVRFAFDFSA